MEDLIHQAKVLFNKLDELTIDDWVDYLTSPAPDEKTKKLFLKKDAISHIAFDKVRDGEDCDEQSLKEALIENWAK